MASSTNTLTIINTILADVNAVVPNFTSLVSSYRLLVGAAEEIHRTPGVSPDVLARAIERYDRTGIIIDILINLLCCKISFSSDFLTVTCAPIDVFRLLSNRTQATDTPHHTAEQILELEVLRRLAERLRGEPGIPPCTPPGPPAFTFPTSFYQPPAEPPPLFAPPPVVAPPTPPPGAIAAAAAAAAAAAPLPPTPAASISPLPPELRPAPRPEDAVDQVPSRSPEAPPEQPADVPAPPPGDSQQLRRPRRLSRH